ncbi:hypothetical protein RHSIM_RhsimUnG0039000 [Rhododendron simsii]|uniref:Uncharacterized protein n=1 Tax=Rhododendron simsii TaxID=118357 RepID=A0A834L5I7_RHOSS|nr:hypothetical protein RHSIM_RhsimUnG0039000 [Rhododendron simsii]
MNSYGRIDQEERSPRRTMIFSAAPVLLKLTDEQFGKLAFIPRISLSPPSSDLSFHMTKRQFPVRLAYVMTINKSQGQSVKFIGVDLRTSLFSYGQLFVALSRCTSFDRIFVFLPEEEIDFTTNIVYPDVPL